MNKIYIVGDNRIPNEALRELANQGMQIIEMNSFSEVDQNNIIFRTDNFNMWDSEPIPIKPIKIKPTKYTSSIGHFDKYLK